MDIEEAYLALIIRTDDDVKAEARALALAVHDKACLRCVGEDKHYREHCRDRAEIARLGE